MNSDFLKFFKMPNFFSRPAGAFGPRPDRDWKILLLSFLSLNFLLTVLVAGLYWSTGERETLSTAPTVGRLNAELLTEIGELYRNRQRQLEVLEIQPLLPPTL